MSLSSQINQLLQGECDLAKIYVLGRIRGEEYPVSTLPEDKRSRVESIISDIRDLLEIMAHGQD